MCIHVLLIQVYKGHSCHLSFTARWTGMSNPSVYSMFRQSESVLATAEIQAHNLLDTSEACSYLHTRLLKAGILNNLTTKPANMTIYYQKESPVLLYISVLVFWLIPFSRNISILLFLFSMSLFIYFNFVINEQIFQ